MNEMYLNDGDATFVGSFTKVCWDRDNGQRYSFGFKPNRGKKFVVTATWRGGQDRRRL
uniref:Uncharacterized protein n=1 Tax=Pseudomonas phage PACT201 TaxID=3230130 RepID=A0AAU8GVQ6_9VIRU